MQCIQRALHHALSNPYTLTTHPAAAAPRFKLTTLTLRVAAATRQQGTDGGAETGGAAAAAAMRGVGSARLLLQDKALKAALMW